MDTKAKVQEIQDRVVKLESNQEMMRRLAEIIVPKLNGEELIEISWIFTSLDQYLLDEVFGFGAPHEGSEDWFFFGAAFGPVKAKTYPTLVTMTEMIFDDKTGEPRDPDQSEADRDVLYLQAIDHDRAHPGVGLVAGTC
jgi:hypothetical protein